MRKTPQDQHKHDDGQALINALFAWIILGLALWFLFGGGLP